MSTENPPPDSVKWNNEPGGNAAAEGASPSGSKPSAAWLPPTVEELQKLLPQYQILQMLGRGGMGAVYKALQTSLDRHVAIKILSNALQEQEAGFTQRFQNEARAMAKLNHPGIVSVYDFGETATGLLYIVMEYVDGTDVSKMIASSGRLHSEHAMAIAAHVCDALAYAHERGIIHRDIKPANIMVGYDGVVKVADFGLAKVTASQAQSGLTQSNVIMGTLAYMAPEALILGAELDRRADIYAVGVMFYQMLTGKLPQGLFEMPSLRVPGLDPRYDKIVASALRDDRELRYSSAEALRRDLDAILTQPVVKVEASAEQAPAALNTQARPRRPAGQPPSAHRAPAQVPARSTQRKGLSGLFWLGLLLLLGGGAVVFWKQGWPGTTSGSLTGTGAGPSSTITREMVLAAVSKLCPDADVSKAKVGQNSDGRFSVDVSGLPVTDFIPLHGLNIWDLYANRVPIDDLSSVAGVGMARLFLMECPNLTDLSPLSKCTTLRDLNLSGSPVADLAPLRGTQIVSIAVSDTHVNDLTPLRGMPLIHFFFDNADADFDVSPLSECVTMERMTIPPSARNIESLRKLPGLRYISHKMDFRAQPVRPMQTAAEFWAYYDRMKPWRLQTPTSAPAESPDRACARWAVAIGAQVWIAGSSAPLASEADIPQTDFKIEKLVFYDGNNKIKEPLVTASDMWRLEDLKELRWLDLRNNHVGDVGVAKLGSLTNLRTLILNHCSLTDASLSVIGQLKQLTWLDLNLNERIRDKDAIRASLYNRITDKGAVHLSNLVNIEKLYLYRSDISDQTLTGVVASLPKLTYLECHRTQVTEAGVQAFRKAKPGCNIKSDWPSAAPAAATASPAPQPHTNTLGMKFVPVPGTKVMFCIHETRRQDYAGYANEAPGVDGSWKNMQLDGVPCGHEDTHPVVGVSLEYAQKFCEWLSRKEGRTYRLPSDREWSFAAGIGEMEAPLGASAPASLHRKIDDEFPWGKSWPPPEGVGNLADGALKQKLTRWRFGPIFETYRDGYPTTAPVMSFKCNGLGIFDLEGNVSEWTADAFDADQQVRVMRGGNWGSGGHDVALSSFRIAQGINSRRDGHGFRVVLAAESTVNAATPIPKLSEEMTAMAARGGRLRVWGNFRAKDEKGELRSIDVSKAAGYSDFVALAGDDYRLYALRKNQAMFALDSEDRKQPVYEVTEVQRLFRDRIWPHYQNGILIIHKESVPALYLESSAGPLRAVAAGFLNHGGYVCIPGTGKAFWLPANGSRTQDHRPPPVELLGNAADAAGMSYCIGVVSQEGRLRIWNFEDVMETSAEYSDIVEIRGGYNFALCRKRDGSVLVWPPTGLKQRWLPAPGVQRVPALPPAVQIRCGKDACAAQMPDGRWIGWGADAEVVAKISAIGPAIDLVIEGLQTESKKGEQARYVAWIEPLPVKQLPPELATLDSQFQALEKERVTVPYEAALSKLNNGYLASLQKAIAAERAAGRLAEVAAFETDQKLLHDTKPTASAVLPDADAPTTPEALKKLRAIWRTEHVKLLATHAANLKAIVDPLDQRLAKLETDLTQAGRPADAKTVQDYRKAVAESALLKNAAAAPAASAADAARAAAPQAKMAAPEAQAPPQPANVQTNSLGMKFVPLPGTKVLFCVHETRRQDYAAFANETPGVSDSWKNMKIEEIPCGDKDDHPVVGVSLLEASKFCEWLSAKEKKTYRLPTDVEWSDAVGLRGLESRDSPPSWLHAKVKDHYPWEGSHPPKTSDLAGNYADVIWHKEFPRKRYTRTYRDGYVTTAPVMSFKPNLYGLYDMGGNAWEWIENLWTGEKGQTDGTLRGGSFAQEAVLSSFRLRFPLSSGVRDDIMAGFRVVMVVE